MKKSILAALMMTLFCGGVAMATPVTVGDADFNNPITTNGVDGVKNWASWNEVSLFGSDALRIAPRGTTGDTWEGAYAAEVRYAGTALQQTLGEVIVGSTLSYTLSVYADSRDEGYSTLVGIALFANNGSTKTTIGYLQTFVTNTNPPVGRDYEKLTLTVDSAALAPYVGQHLGINLYTVQHAEPALFDYVQLARTDSVTIPEPASIWLFSVGLLALRRRRS
jgi:hypothetical protein